MLKDTTYTVEPIKKALGRVSVPGSKSISNRALLLSALSKTTVSLKGLLRADDTDRMLDALQTLGLAVQTTETDCFVQGCSGQFPQREAELFVGNAGTVARTLTAALSFAEGTYRIDGVQRMRERPIKDLVDALVALGAKIIYESKEGYLPLRILPSQVTAHRVSTKGNVSSQFLTAVLLLAPTLALKDGLTIEIVGDLISRPYVDMTVAMMRTFGANVYEESGTFHVASGGYDAPASYTIEPDASSASYFLALGAMTEGAVTVEGLSRESLQGDMAFLEPIKAMGARVSIGDGGITVRRPESGLLESLEWDCTSIPDAAMTLVPMALKAKGPLKLTGIASWRVKETDRLDAMACEMRKLGAKVEAGDDWIQVTRDAHVTDVEIETYNDHRMAMAMSLSAAAERRVFITNPACVNKTFPNYFNVLESILRR